MRHWPVSFRALLLSALFVLALCGQALAGDRTALVIGNAAYPTAPLKNPVNDATDMAAALTRLGFQVMLLKNASMQQMEEAVREFGLRLRKGGLGVFFFAGHGVQVAGENYLVPVNAVIQSEGDVKYGCLNAGLVLAKMEDAGNGLNVVVLDACRNNPFARSFRSAEAGLARMDAPTGSLIAYATAPGKVASDGDGRNGLYTQHLLRHIATPGLSVTDLFMNVREGVVRDSGKKQVPWENTSLIGRFSFAGEAAAPAPAPGPAPQASLAPKPTPPAAPAPKPAQATLAAPAASSEEARLMADLGAYRGTKRDEDVEAKLLGRAKALAAKGSAHGRFAQGWLSSDEVERNKAAEQAARLGIPLALVCRAEFLAGQPLTPADEAEARELLRRAVALGEPEARLDLGKLLIMGVGGPKDASGGERLFADLASEHPAYGLKVSLAYFELGEKHLPKAEADAKGLAFARRAASQGDVEAMALMGELYEFGLHAPKSPHEAWTWYEKAASRGHIWSMLNLAQALLSGSEHLGATRNEQAAFRWYRKAAELGNESGLIEVARLTLKGMGTAKDVKRGLGMLADMAERGNTYAQLELGNAFKEGHDVPRNNGQAYFWYAVAERLGNRGAVVYLEDLAPQLPAEQRAAVEARAAKWKPRGGKAVN